MWPEQGIQLEISLLDVIVKCGPDGILIHEKSANRSTRLPSWHDPDDERIVDVTGAGDSFCGGFLVGLVNSGDCFYAARQGLVSSSLVIEGYGATYALSRPKTVIQKRINQIVIA